MTLALVAAVAIVPTTKPFSRYMGALSVLCATLVWLASYGQGYVLGSGWLRRAAVKVGERSFSICLAHIVAFAIAKSIVHAVLPASADLWTQRAPLLLVVGLLTLAALVGASYRWVEVPWRTRGRQVAEKFAARRIGLDLPKPVAPHEGAQ